MAPIILVVNGVGPRVGDSGRPILRQADGVEYVVATLHGFQVKVNSNTKQDCDDDFATP